MKRTKQFLSVLLALIMVMSIIPMSSITASAAATSGSCGENLTWTFDDVTGTLTISGTGAMNDYVSNNSPWKSYKEEIKTVVIDNSVTTIGNYAFYGCHSLTSITVPDSVIAIGDYAFNNCDFLTSITIPNSVTTIGDYAFYGCYDLTSVTIPDSITTIGDGVFALCYSLTNVTIPDSVTTIGDGAFMACNSLTSITIPDSVTTIATYAFNDCESLTNVTIGDSVTTIGDHAFTNCNSLIGITVDSNNPYYSSNEYGVLFNKDKSTLVQYPIGKTQTNYTIPDSVTTIGVGAFYTCGNLISVTIPNSVAIIGEDAFALCNNMTSVIIGDGVTTIGEGAFSSCKSLTSVIIGGGVTTIGNYAFHACESLKNIVIPDSVTTIGYSAFHSCYSLISVTFGNNVTTIGDGAFSFCESLTSVTIPGSVTTIGDQAFRWCEKLISITLPDSMVTIGELVFAETEYYNNESNWEMGVLYIGNHLIDVKLDVTGLRSIKTGTKTIANGAFSNCENITSVIISDSITTISENAFALCTSLTSVTIPNSITTIRRCAFQSCNSLTNITIPDSVTTIDELAFTSCGSLTDVTVPDSVVSLGTSVFSGCINLTSATLPNGTIIPASTFSYCTSLTSITIPDNITTIGEGAFSLCTGLTSITIPNSVTTIGDYAFFYCNSLTDVYYSGTEEQWNEISIGEMNESLLNAKIHFLGDVHNHSFGEWTTVTEATCTEDGLKKCVCSCGEEKTETIPAKGHIEETISAVAPTCTETGLTAGTKCTVCDEVLTPQEEVPALGHDFSTKWTIDVPASCKETGSKSHHCTRCEVKTDVTVIPKSEHNYGEWTTVTETTCTEDGLEKRVCSACGDEETRTTDSIGHSKKTMVLVPATCTSTGMGFDVCENCGETLGDTITLPKKDHTVGEWEISLAPTSDTAGEKVQKCTVCDEIINRESIPALGNDSDGDDDAGVAHDEKTDISIEYDKSEYDGDVDIDVEKTINETAFSIVDLSLDASQTTIFDITMTLDGEKTQPKSKVTVRIPLPAGYDPQRTCVYHVNIETGKTEKMEAEYVDGYLVFETTHFSFYAVVEEYNYTFSIQNPSRTEIRYKDGIVLHANVEGTLPAGAKIVWSANNSKFKTTEQDNGNALKIVSNSNGYTTFTAKLIDADGNELATDTIEMRSKAGLFDIIGGFFRGLFRLTKIYEK